MLLEAPSVLLHTLLAVLLMILLPTAQAQSTITASATPAATSNSFPLSTSGSNPSLNPANAPGAPSDPNSISAQNAAGASGDSSGGVDLSTGTIVAICVVVGVVVLIGVSSAILFYLAKKRQWAVRASLRRSARRVTSTLSLNKSANGGRTPRADRTTFSNLDKHPQPRATSQPKRQQKQRPEPSPLERQQRQDRKSAQAIARAKEAVERDSAGSVHDLEKGFGVNTTISTTARSNATPSPESRFDMEDSPNPEGGRGKWWSLGRK